MIHTHYLDLATRLKKKIQVVLNKKRNFLPSNFVCPKDNLFPIFCSAGAGCTNNTPGGEDPGAVCFLPPPFCSFSAPFRPSLSFSCSFSALSAPLRPSLSFSCSFSALSGLFFFRFFGLFCHSRTYYSEKIDMVAFYLRCRPKV